MKNQRSSDTLFKHKAYCGDGILRLCLGKIFLVDNYHHLNMHYCSKLESNQILKCIVLKNELPHFPGARYDATAWSLGTLYEKRLFDIFIEHGIEASIQFVRDTFKTGNLSAKEVYMNII